LAHFGLVLLTFHLSLGLFFIYDFGWKCILYLIVYMIHEFIIVYTLLGGILKLLLLLLFLSSSCAPLKSHWRIWYI